MSNMLLVQSILLAVAILTIIVGFFFYSCDHQGIRQVKFLDRTDIVIMSVTTLVYAVISLTNLGSMNQHKNPWHGYHHGDKIILKLAKPMVVAKIDYFVGYKKGSYFVTGFDKNNESTVIFSVNQSFYNDKNKQFYNACLGCFSWQRLRLEAKNLHKPFSVIVFNIESSPVDFYKITLLNKKDVVIDYQPMNQKHAKISKDIVGNSHDVYKNLSSSALMYDEIYYVTSAYEYINGMIPDVFQQPQLGVLGMALGIIIFGFSSFGFRIFMACSGILMLPLMYIFAKRVFRNRNMAILAVFLLFIDPMHYVINQIAILDPLMVLFLFLEYYCLWLYFEARTNGVGFRLSLRYMLFVGLFLGLGFSTKWNILFSIPVILVVIICTEMLNKELFLKLPTKILSLFVLLLILPLMIYILSYVPVAKILHVSLLFKFVWQQQIFNFTYMMSVPSVIWYASKAWQWIFNQGVFPLMVIPGVDTLTNPNFDLMMHGEFGQIWLFYLNSALVSIFFPVIIALLYRIKNKKAFFIFMAILAQYLPYFFLKRSMFNYYFYSVEPLYILGVCYLFEQLKSYSLKSYNKILLTYILINIIVFIWLLPLMYNINLRLEYVLLVYRSLVWFSLSVQLLIFIIFYIFYHNNLRG